MSDMSVTEKEHAAIARLSGSRQYLREVLHGLAHPPRHPLSLKNGVSGVADELLSRARSLPGTALLMNAVSRAWQRHPARPAVESTLARYRPALERKARKQPIAMLGLAFGVGALLWLARPWRLMLRPKVVAKLVPAVFKHVTGKNVTGKNAGPTRSGR